MLVNKGLSVPFTELDAGEMHREGWGWGELPAPQLFVGRTHASRGQDWPGGRGSVADDGQSRCRGLGGGRVGLASLEEEVGCQRGLGGSGLD